ncbi:hypothetical protein [Kocuria carniphila]|uniref:hypothetical protein n=1 Tax=Kocuria carniphila TaxID=262208 RepID=UPI0034DB4CD6
MKKPPWLARGGFFLSGILGGGLKVPQIGMRSDQRTAKLLNNPLLELLNNL